MDRKNYWNQSYLSYWRERVAESEKAGKESAIVTGDAKTEGDEIYEKVFQDYALLPGRILDVGCAWGRMFGIFKKHGLKISGIDISDAMIDMAKEEWKDDSDVEALSEAEAESLPFVDGHFDNLCCLAVFDATYQDRAIVEFLRVVKPGGRLYVTGKNTRYAADDQLALNAEIGARGKGHPNYFTDVSELVRQLNENGHKTVGEYYFPRRGDFADFSFTHKVPETFYEYLIVIERGEDIGEFSVFSDQYSETFKASDAGQTV